MRHGVQAGRNPTKRNECEDMKTIRAIEVRQETWHLHPQGESLPPLPPPFLVLAHVQQLSATYSSK